MTVQLSEFVGSISTAITRRADRYVDILDESSSEDALGVTELKLLERFERYTAEVLDRYVPPGPRTRDSLVFAHLYSAAAHSSPEDLKRAAIAALLAAEVEVRGPLRLTTAQTERLAKIFERLGRQLSSAGLALHAALAFDRAGSQYLLVDEYRSRDRCQLFALRARHRARPRGWVKSLETVSDVLCGYGYQPYRLLGWVVFQLVGFSLALILVFEAPVVEAVYTCLANYLQPLFGEDDGKPHGVQILLAVEAYTGLVSLSVFFALLVRRWFRM